MVSHVNLGLTTVSSISLIPCMERSLFSLSLSLFGPLFDSLKNFNRDVVSLGPAAVLPSAGIWSPLRDLINAQLPLLHNSQLFYCRQ